MPSASDDPDPSPPPAKRVNVLGVGVTVLNLGAAVRWIHARAAANRKSYICVTGVHGVTEAQSDPAFRAILNGAFLNTPDGMPMVWMGRLRGFREMNRVYGPDLMHVLCDASQTSGLKHFFYGGAEGVAESLKNRLLTLYPRLQVAGTYTPPFRRLNEEELPALQNQLRACQPDIFWVGLSTPKQERFMAEFLPLLDTRIMIGVGAAFDLVSGRIRQAPRWIQRSGFEWLFRLSQEPRRLAKRYLINNPLFLCRVLLQLSGLRRYPLPDTEA